MSLMFIALAGIATTETVYTKTLLKLAPLFGKGQSDNSIPYEGGILFGVMTIISFAIMVGIFRTYHHMADVLYPHERLAELNARIKALKTKPPL